MCSMKALDRRWTRLVGVSVRAMVACMGVGGLASGVMGQTTLDAGSIDGGTNSSLSAYKVSGASGGQAVRPVYHQRASAVGFGGRGVDGGVRDVDMFTLTPELSSVDLAFPTNGFGVVVGRSYNGAQLSSGSAYANDGFQGWNWFQDSRPELVQGTATNANDMLYLMLGGARFLEFRKAGTATNLFAGVNGTQAVAQVIADGSSSPGIIEVRDLGGRVWTFFDFDGDAQGAQGQLWKVVDQDGTGSTAYIGVSSSQANALATFEVSGGQKTARITKFVDASDRLFEYAYSTVGGKTRLASVIAKIKTGGTWSSPTGATEVGRVEYSYYDGTTYTSNGLAGDLKFVTVTTPLSSGGSLVRKTYYRYLVASGQEHLVRLVVGAEGIRRYTGSNIENEADATLKASSTHFFVYNSGARTIDKVTFNGECGCAGSSANGEHTLALSTNGSFGGSLTNATYDSSGDWSSTQWYKRAIITKPDSTATAIYFDEVGQQLGKVSSSTTAFSGSPAPLLWISKVNRDSSGRMTDIGTPAAGDSSGYNHTTGAVAVKTTGLMRVTTFHSSGRLQATPEYVKSKDGSGGSPITSSRSASFDTTRGSKSFAEGTNTVYLNRLLATQHDAYRSSSVIDSTTMSRTFWNDTAGNAQYWTPKTMTTTLPALESGDSSGPATVTMKVWMDQRGRPIFSQDGAGKYSYTKYNGLGQVVKRIEDPASTDSDASADASTFGITLSSTALNYVTTYTYDDQGRMLTTTLPSGRVTANHYTQLADGRMVTLSVGKQSGGTSEGPVSYAVTNAAGKSEAQGVIALPTTSSANGSTTAAMSTWITTTSSDVVGAVAVGTLKQLSVSIYDASGAHLESTRVFNSIPTAYSSATSTIYDETTYVYDEMGRTRRVKDPTGTITRNIFDSQGRVTQRQVGTDDTGLPGGMTGGTSNMVKVEEITYDAGSVGNGLVTSRTQSVDSTTGNDRTTSYSYDFRSRLVLQTNPVAPHSLMKYDDAGHVIAAGGYSTAPSASSDPTTTTTNRVSLSETVYNSRGQVRSSTRHAITQSTGASADTLVSSTWYDAAGRVIKSRGEQLSKVFYDVLGRPTNSFTLAKDNDTTYADAATVTGDTVTDERQTLYDNTGGTGLALMSVQVARHPKDTTTTGALDAVGDAIDVVAAGSANMKGRVQISSFYYDALDRQSATVSLGTNAGATYTRSTDSSVGTRSASRLIQSTVYNPDGTVLSTTDALGRVARTEYDAARRRTKTIANYVDGTPGGGTFGDNDQVIEYAYTTGLMTSLTAKMPSSTDDQTTTYTYGVTTTGTLASALVSNRHLRQVQYPDSAGGTDVVKYAYNRLGQQTAMLDQAGNQIDTTYDVGGRETARAVSTLASGFDGTVRRIAMAYLTRGVIDTVTQYDAATSGTATDQVKYEYDAWGNLEHFRQDVDSTMDGSGVSTSGRAAFDVVSTHAKATPTGGSVHLRRTAVDYKAASTTFEAIGYTYGTSGSINDALGRVATVTTAVSGGSPTTIASYDYLGSGQLVGTTLDAAGLETSVFGYNSGTGAHTYADLDTFGRPTRWDWHRVGGAALYDYTISYDENSNPTSSVDNLAVRHSTSKRIFDTVYSLDGLNRVIGADEGQKTGSAIESGTRTRNELWNSLSMTGNWGNRQLDSNGDGDYGDAEDRDEPVANNTFNKANEWTARRIQKAGTGNYESFTYTHDAVGNLTTQTLGVFASGTQTSTSGRTFVYDAFGRLVQVTDPNTEPGSENRIAQYKYNGLGFRILHQTDADNDGTYEDSERTYYMYDDRWRMVGSFVDSTATPKEAWIYHNAGLAGRGGSSYIDSVILRDRDANTETSALEERRVYCQNWRADVVAVTRDDGTPWEYVRYSSYGEPTVYPVADVNRDGVVNSTDATEWTKLKNAQSNICAVDLDLNRDTILPDTADDDLFDESYTANAGNSGKNRVSTPDTTNRKGYAGYEWDQSIHAYHVRHRVYLPSVGRWSRRDPLSYVDGISLYQYVRSSSLAATDPTGLVAWYCSNGKFVPIGSDLPAGGAGCQGDIACESDVQSVRCKAACALSPGAGGVTVGDPPRFCCLCTSTIDKEYPLPRQPSKGVLVFMQILTGCILEHEYVHMNQCSGSQACKEAEAYAAELYCLMSQYSNCPSEACRELLAMRIAQVARQYDDFNFMCTLDPSPTKYPRPCRH